MGEGLTANVVLDRGSQCVATADRLVRTMIQSGQSLTDTVRMITKTPAGIMGIGDRKGSIAKGFDADLTIFDADINVHYTIAGGDIIYQKEKEYASRSSANQ